VGWRKAAGTTASWRDDYSEAAVKRIADALLGGEEPT
jgi:hypothetical protein